MSEGRSAREEILDRIQEALPGSAADVAGSYRRISRGYVRRGVADGAGCLELLKDRLLDYDSKVIEVQFETEIAHAVEQALADEGEMSVLADPAFPPSWLPGSHIGVTRDERLSVAALDGERTVLTTSEAAVAATGTIFLVHEGAQGRRAITLIPDHHICLVRRDQVFETLPEAMAVVDAKGARPMTTISGPSATSDIEMTRIRGVHGPRRLTVILYGELATV